MQFRQKPDETIDDFVTRARTQALKCDFSDQELAERIIELIIASTPYDNLRRDLLGREKGYALADALSEGRRYEALSAGSHQAQNLGQTEVSISTRVPKAMYILCIATCPTTMPSIR